MYLQHFKGIEPQQQHTGSQPCPSNISFSVCVLCVCVCVFVYMFFICSQRLMGASLQLQLFPTHFDN